MAEEANNEEAVDSENDTEETTTEEEEETSTKESLEDKPPAGHVPYQALKEEREKRKALEEEISTLKSSISSDEEQDEDSDEAKRVKELTARLDTFERKETLRELETTHPYLKDKSDEFNEFLEDEENKNIPLHKAAQLFLAEKGQLSGETSERKGNEKPTGGPTAAPQTGLSTDEVERLRTQDFKQYEKLVREGKLKFAKS